MPPNNKKVGIQVRPEPSKIAQGRIERTQDSGLPNCLKKIYSKKKVALEMALA